MNTADFLGKYLDVNIDRPLGSKHPKHSFIYPVNYGFVPNTLSADGEELDCYVLGIHEPINSFYGKCIAYIHRLNDDDDKLIIVPNNKNYSNQEIQVLTEFQEQYFKSIIIRDPSSMIFQKNIPELSISNLENTLKFYNTIGFKVEYSRPEDKFAFLSLNDDIQFMVQEISDSKKWDVAPLSYPFGNGINFQLEVDNVQSIYDSLKSANYKIAFEIEENWYRQDEKLLGNKEFLVQDPDGYLLRFSEDIGSFTT